MGGPLPLLDRCAVARCRESEAIRYLGKPCCWFHFNALTDDNGNTEALQMALGIKKQAKQQQVA